MVSGSSQLNVSPQRPAVPDAEYVLGLVLPPVPVALSCVRWRWLVVAPVTVESLPAGATVACWTPTCLERGQYARAHEADPVAGGRRRTQIDGRRTSP